MRLLLQTEEKLPDWTLGRLLVDSEFSCFTCEDPVREVPGQPVEQWKVFAKTAIPAGVYAITIEWSNRFKRPLPRLQGVPGFTGILIHPGNTHEDTQGCILPGLHWHQGGVSQSIAAFNVLFNKLQHAKDAGRENSIEVRR
jgi:hypothetical protein